MRTYKFEIRRDGELEDAVDDGEAAIQRAELLDAETGAVEVFKVGYPLAGVVSRERIWPVL